MINFNDLCEVAEFGDILRHGIAANTLWQEWVSK